MRAIGRTGSIDLHDGWLTITRIVDVSPTTRMVKYLTDLHHEPATAERRGSLQLDFVNASFHFDYLATEAGAFANLVEAIENLRPGLKKKRGWTLNPIRDWLRGL